MKRAASSAHTQIAAQALMLEKLANFLAKDLHPHQLVTDEFYIQLDGYCETANEVLIAECWADIGKAKVAQKHPIAADVLKLSVASAAIRRLQPTKNVTAYIVFATRMREGGLVPEEKALGHAASQ